MHGAVKKQEKRLRAKLQLQKGEDEDLDDQDEEAEEDERLWGAKKRAYYDADEQVIPTSFLHPQVSLSVTLVHGGSL